MPTSTVGVLVMAYGSPASPDDIEGYYTHVRRGRPPTPELLADLQRRYEAIGGVSPLVTRTTAQLDALEAVLGPRYVVALGQKHASPFIEDGVARLRERGAGPIVGLVLAPHVSALSTGEYHARAASAAGVGNSADPSRGDGEAGTAGIGWSPGQRKGAAGARGMAYTAVGPWYDRPELIELLTERVLEALARFPSGANVETLVTAHSLPLRALEVDAPSYPEQLRQTGEAIAARAGLGARWRVAWQSAGRTADPWIGPDILEVIRALPAEGIDGVVVCPAGFVSDHLEVLYDVDIEARAVAQAAGLPLERTESLNDDARFVSVLASLVHQAAGTAAN